MARGENIYKRKDGRWEGRYPKGRKTDGSLHYGYIYGQKYQEVRQQVIVQKALYQGQLPKKKRGGFSGNFSQWAHVWLTAIQQKGIKASTLMSYQNKLDVHFVSQFGERPLDEITTEQLNEWVQQKRSSLRIGTIHVLFSLLKRCLQEAVNQGFLGGNPCNQVTLPVWKKTKVNALSRKEQKKLTSYCEKTKQGSVILFALETGLRAGEICGLKWTDIDLKKKVLHVRRTRQRVFSESSATRTQVVDQSPKTVASSRIVPLTKKAYQILLLNKVHARTDYVFSRYATPLEPRILSRLFTKIRKILQFTEVTFHSLRHTFATRCIELGGNISAVSKLLGHASIKLTLDTYTTSFYEEQLKTIGRLNTL